MSQLPIIEPPATPLSLREDPPAANSRGSYAFVTLGCPKNLVDSEKMLGTLAIDGYTLVSDPDGADFVIVNTCGFIESSRQESKAVIREMLDLKRQGRTKGVIVAGCLPERLGSGLLDELPEIDHIVGVFGRDEINRVADHLIGGAREQRELFRPAPIKAMDDTARLRITPKHFAYLKISEGCDRTCTFCAIPKMRGKHITKPIEMVITEAQELAKDGVKELNIVAQDTTYYGLDLYGEVRLVELLKELEQVEGIEWIRLMYLYPIHFTDQLIDTITVSEKILPYLDMPLQHINDQMLKRMQRRVNRAQTEELIGKLRERVPNLVMRTTFITGFPGETDAQFEELGDFVAQARFERMGVFTYSLEPGTPAEKLDGHLPDDVKQARMEELMALQQDIAFEYGDSLIGFELDALLDEPLEEGLWLGRTFADAPEIDGNIIVSGEGLTQGQFVPVEIVERDGYDWIGEAVVDEGTLMEPEMSVTEDKPTEAGKTIAPLSRGAVNAPNLITISRLVLAVVLFYLIDFDGYWLTAATVFLIAASTDFLDGYIARKYGLVTTLGRIMDPFADKIIIAGSFVFLLGETNSGVNSWMVIIIIGREMFVTSLRGFLEQHGMDFSASLSGKLKMVLQCAAVTASLLSLSSDFSNFAPWVFVTRDILLWSAVAITIYSGGIYVYRAGIMIRQQSAEQNSL